MSYTKDEKATNLNFVKFCNFAPKQFPNVNSSLFNLLSETTWRNKYPQAFYICLCICISVYIIFIKYYDLRFENLIKIANIWKAQFFLIERWTPIKWKSSCTQLLLNYGDYCTNGHYLAGNWASFSNAKGTAQVYAIPWEKCSSCTILITFQ